MKKLTFFVTLCTVVGLVYVHLEVESLRTGYQIQKLEETKSLLLDRSRALEYNVARLSAPSILERKLSAEKIELSSPKSWQTLVISDGRKVRQPSPTTGPMDPANFGRFFVGTARAEAKDS